MSPGSQSQQSIAYKGEPHSSPPNGSEVRPKKVDLSTTHPGSLPNTNRPPAGTKVPAPAPKEDTLDHLGSTIHEQAPGNVYQGSSTSSWGVKAFPRIARDCGPMPPGRDTPHQYKPPVGHHYGHPPPGREHHHYPGTGPLLHCPALPSRIWPIFTIQLQLWKMPLYHRGQVLHNYSKPLVVIMVPNPVPLVDTWHCQKPIIIPLRF